MVDYVRMACKYCGARFSNPSEVTAHVKDHHFAELLAEVNGGSVPSSNNNQGTGQILPPPPVPEQPSPMQAPSIIEVSSQSDVTSLPSSFESTFIVAQAPPVPEHNENKVSSNEQCLKFWSPLFIKKYQAYPPNASGQEIAQIAQCVNQSSLPGAGGQEAKRQLAKMIGYVPSDFFISKKYPYVNQFKNDAAALAEINADGYQVHHARHTGLWFHPNLSTEIVLDYIEDLKGYKKAIGAIIVIKVNAALMQLVMELDGGAYQQSVRRLADIYLQCEQDYSFCQKVVDLFNGPLYGDKRNRQLFTRQGLEDHLLHLSQLKYRNPDDAAASSIKRHIAIKIDSVLKKYRVLKSKMENNPFSPVFCFAPQVPKAPAVVQRVHNQQGAGTKGHPTIEQSQASETITQAAVPTVPEPALVTVGDPPIGFQTSHVLEAQPGSFAQGPPSPFPTVKDAAPVEGHPTIEPSHPTETITQAVELTVPEPALVTIGGPPIGFQTSHVLEAQPGSFAQGPPSSFPTVEDAAPAKGHPTIEPSHTTETITQAVELTAPDYDRDRSKNEDEPPAARETPTDHQKPSISDPDTSSDDDIPEYPLEKPATTIKKFESFLAAGSQWRYPKLESDQKDENEPPKTELKAKSKLLESKKKQESKPPKNKLKAKPKQTSRANRKDVSNVKAESSKCNLSNTVGCVRCGTDLADFHKQTLSMAKKYSKPSATWVLSDGLRLSNCSGCTMVGINLQCGFHFCKNCENNLRDTEGKCDSFTWYCSTCFVKKESERNTTNSGPLPADGAVVRVSKRKSTSVYQTQKKNSKSN